jgi:diguanylate cyclase (GGDEF)-like protein
MLQLRANEKYRPGTVRAIERDRSAMTWLKSNRAALAAAAVGLTISLLAASAVARWESWVTGIEFAAVSRNHAVMLQNGVNEYLSRLKALRTLFESANDAITRSEFEVFSARLFEEHPGISRVGWVPRVSHKERAEFESAAIADGLPGYHIHGSADPAVAAPETYYPIFYSTEPKTSPVYGVDLAADPSRWVTFERARDDEAVTVLPSVPLLVDTAKFGTIVAVPVYVKGTSRDDVADRRRNIAGFIVGTFQISHLLGSILEATAPLSDLVLDVYDPDVDPDALPGRRPRARLLPASHQGAQIDRLEAGPRWSGALSIGDTSWRIVSTPLADGRLTAHHDRTGIVLAASLLVTAIMVAYLCAATRHSRRLELANRRVYELAQTDALTGLANRRAFFDRLDHCLAEAQRSGKRFAVLYFDLDHFKDVNDTLGHAFGDELLRQVADRLRAIVSPTDLVARFGGDEFAVLESNVLGPAQAEALAKNVALVLGRPYAINGAAVHVTASIGIACHASGLTTPDAVMMQADLALYRAKEDGRNCWRFHSVELGEQLRERVAISEELRGALEGGELRLEYQPQVELSTGRIIGLEALLRWHHPTRGAVSPALFIPIAERSGCILQLGQWAFDEACRQYRVWQDQGIAPKVLAVNFSALQFKAAADLIGNITRSLERWAVAPGQMEVELTESVLMDAREGHADCIERLRESGVRIALDDFGTGYSSLSYLTAYPVDRLKIAQQLVFGVTEEPRNATVVRTAIRLARELDIEFVAEGVETQAQVDFLIAAGCEQAQGFHFSRPVSADLATELLRQGRIETSKTPGRRIPTAA